MKIDTNATLLTAESTAYAINGNSGTSHKIRLNVDGEIYVCKSTAEQVASLKHYAGKQGRAVLRVNSRKENLSLSLELFEAE